MHELPIEIVSQLEEKIKVLFYEMIIILFCVGNSFAEIKFSPTMSKRTRMK
jgi:hypothetical protein